MINLAPRTLEQLRAEIESLHVKIAAEEHRNQDFADELSTIKDSCVEKSDNIQKVGNLWEVDSYLI